MDVKNILVVKLSAIGDVIHALPVAEAIKKTSPEAHLTWVAEPAAYELVKACPFVDEALLFKKKEFRTLAGFRANYGPFKALLRQRHYDVSFDLQGLFKSAAVVYVAGADKKLGMCNMRELSDKISRPVIGPHAQGHIVERYLDVARAIGCDADDAKLVLDISAKDCELASKIMQQAGADIHNKYVVLAIGANWPNKRWPTKYFAQLSDWLYDQGIIPVIIGGGAVDTNSAAEITAYANIPPVNLVGKTSLLQLAHIIKNAQLTLGGDTGPVHMSAGLGKPTVMVMGPTDANRNGPFRQGENAIEVPRDCKYCWKRACPKGEDCLAAISVDMVKERILRNL